MYELSTCNFCFVNSRIILIVHNCWLCLVSSISRPIKFFIDLRKGTVYVVCVEKIERDTVCICQGFGKASSFFLHSIVLRYFRSA